ncbi:DUF550 domain-containing protein [Salmonella enterica subsp. enterica]|nr:DUF550 domain-containing protein [Salmonella enterica subsp. enterica serovar Gaminara]EBQ3497746.1 DUF550 domain-containing protein [Salmonella enterica]EBV1481999.1 DUF550 domain-containing protein [Salmonella enterica subsp. enterica serovar Hvittingfoss]EDV6059838.1 DUF550 domain-containing protein [Salmonella enterica subsp. enterica serovar Minnesota]EDW7941810.1 DUF550 domain-containing protein [Salmonella enterica subsp. enterica serovar Ruiru]
MTTITKEWLQQTIAEFENTRDDIPFGLSDDDAKILIVLKQTLAALTAEPVRYLNKFSGTCVTLEQQSNAADDVAVYMPLYASPPASEREQVRREHAEWSDKTFGDVGPVGPLKHLSKEALETAAEPDDLSEWADMQFLLWDAQRRAGISDEQITLAMVEKLAVNKKREWPEPKDGEPRLHIKEQPAPVVPDEMATSDDMNLYQKSFAQGRNAFRAALLQGAEPVSQTYKSQHTQFEQVADLYEMQFDDGRTCAFHTDAQKAAQWLQACDGNRVQEYVKLERLRNALSGNYPVTPDGWISCSEQMPVIGELNWRTSFPLLVTCEIGVIPAYYGFVSVNGDRHYGFMESLKYGDDNGNHPQTNEYGLISNVTHWMPLPEPPMEEK